MNLIEQLPHKAPALLLNAVLNVDADGAACSILKALHPSLTTGGLMPAPLALEAIAQAAAVWMCWRYPAEPGDGMLVKCRDFAMQRRLLDNASGLRAIARPVSVGSATGLYLFSGEVLDATDSVLASASFMIMVNNRPA
jgi:predicted hotdog family 3-hydroxylacyl-ACP dehydratase